MEKKRIGNILVHTQSDIGNIVGRLKGCDEYIITERKYRKWELSKDQLKDFKFKFNIIVGQAQIMKLKFEAVDSAKREIILDALNYDVVELVNL